MGQTYFTAELFDFLRQLKRHNRREWFLRNKSRYESVLRDPCLRFIADLAEPLHRLSPWLVADPRPSGGSLMRIYRDIRFSPDKRLYKTNVGMHFSHSAGKKEIHAPGFYLHLEPESCFLAAGSWRPDPKSLARIRNAIAQKPEMWKKARRGLSTESESLSRPPRGYPADHPFVEDLKHKSFVALSTFTDATVCSSGFMAESVKAGRRISPLVGFLSQALGLKY
ncbi:MAG TPA: DUF2461 domain-containing protein [Terriglobales bacterium]|nr:DUF2461 domain-containing protein [Terriglobales bacterium]